MDSISTVGKIEMYYPLREFDWIKPKAKKTRRWIPVCLWSLQAVFLFVLSQSCVFVCFGTVYSSDSAETNPTFTNMCWKGFSLFLFWSPSIQKACLHVSHKLFGFGILWFCISNPIKIQVLAPLYVCFSVFSSCYLFSYSYSAQLLSFINHPSSCIYLCLSCLFFFYTLIY